MDITDPSSVAAAAALTDDVTILINNAGMASTATLLDGTMQDVRAPMESHYYGTLSVTRTFAPHLIANAPAAVLIKGLQPAISVGARRSARTRPSCRGVRQQLVMKCPGAVRPQV